LVGWHALISIANAAIEVSVLDGSRVWPLELLEKTSLRMCRHKLTMGFEGAIYCVLAGKGFSNALVWLVKASQHAHLSQWGWL
jgi:hypothetical protein